jgi:threonylcarbamoyladenosine tRNA methylthiotransferase MtaB
MTNVVPMEVRRERNERLRILSQKKLRNFYSKFVGEKRKVLFEHHTDNKYMSGFTDNYVKVILPKNEYCINTIKEVSLENIDDDKEAVAAILI